MGTKIEESCVSIKYLEERNPTLLALQSKRIGYLYVRECQVPSIGENNI